MWRRLSSSNGWKIESARPSNSSGLTRKRVHSARLNAGVALTHLPSRQQVGIAVVDEQVAAHRLGKARRGEVVLHVGEADARRDARGARAGGEQRRLADAEALAGLEHGRGAEHLADRRSRGTGCSGSRRAPRSRARRRARARSCPVACFFEKATTAGMGAVDEARRAARYSFIGRASSAGARRRTARSSGRRGRRPPRNGSCPASAMSPAKARAPALAEQRVLAPELARLVAADAGHHRRARGGRHEGGRELAARVASSRRRSGCRKSTCEQRAQVVEAADREAALPQVLRQRAVEHRPQRAHQHRGEVAAGGMARRRRAGPGPCRSPRRAATASGSRAASAARSPPS